ncbi:MAG TPA: hypothetical protein VGE77_07065 [Nocardioides sp.]
MPPAKRSIPDLALRAEGFLADRARAGTEPITTKDLAAAITEGDRKLPVASLTPVLKHVAERGRFSWSRNLLAWVETEAGAPFDGSSSDPAEVRELWHPRIARHFALDED